MIEMNVAEENVADIVRFEAGFAKIVNHVVERRFRSGIEKRDSVIRLERGRGNDTGVAKLSRIENVNLHARLFF